MENDLLEHTVFEATNVKITNRRAIFGSKTYAMSNITSVDMGRQDPDGCAPMFFYICGGLAVLISVGSIINNPGSTQWAWVFIGVIAIIAGYGIQRSQFPTFSVKIGSASGETQALSSSNEALIRSIVDAMNEAIIQQD